MKLMNSRMNDQESWGSQDMAGVRNNVGLGDFDTIVRGRAIIMKRPGRQGEENDWVATDVDSIL